MMGGSCSRHQDHPDGSERRRQQRNSRDGSGRSNSRRGRVRSRSFSSAVGRLCGGDEVCCVLMGSDLLPLDA